MLYAPKLLDRRNLLAVGTAVGALLAGVPAFAQQAAPAETVVVTGSRIPVLNATSASPISTARPHRFN